MRISLIDSNRAIPILVETDGLAGVRKVAGVLAKDIELVTDKLPELIDEKDLKNGNIEECIFVATVGNSKLLESLEAAGKIDTTKINGKWEVYQTALVEKPFEGVKRAVVIVGSDKRGTIYGMFSLSEYIGVTSLVFFGDAAPKKIPEPLIKDDFCTVSKEPSVKYRGFFINDEWPCYGNWVTKHYGDFNAESYEQVFLFLLRMKGNYMWPAMWSASFPIDGPEGKNEELADLLGVVMGYSHHEPCLRASEEWDKVRGVGTKYGNEWNYVTNEQGLLNYWEDALIRSGKFDNLITIGMRGERDTSMLGEDSTMQENVELLKKIITSQKALIDKHVRPYRKDVPMLLALYKEVEQYYYGNDEIQGLNEWDGLDDVVCMLCEDNFGHMRTLPTKKMRDKKQKFGMYYHFDYHGGPVSYEWVDSTPFSKTWEQMCQAYDSGIKDVWIVNVGDVKFHEVPLTYFMNLAYDYEKWGSSNMNSSNEYLTYWTKKTFPDVSEATQSKIEFVLNEYITLNHLRRPESLNASIYHPCNYNEATKMLKKVTRVENVAEEVYASLNEAEKNAFYSCVYYSATASMNNIKLNLYAALNKHYAEQGRQVANKYKELAKECLKRDREFKSEFAKFMDGKWDGMQLASHIGFTKWNDDGCKNPILCEVTPVERKRMNVSRKDDVRIYDRVYGAPMMIEVNDFIWEGDSEVILEVANDGEGTLNYEISALEGEIPAWLHITPVSGEVTDLAEVSIKVDKNELSKQYKDEIKTVTLKVTDKETLVLVKISARGHYADTSLKNVFYSRNGEFIIRADHFAEVNNTADTSLMVIDNYGKYGAGLKAFPVINSFEGTKDAPSVTYRIFVEKEGDYTVKLFTTPTNPSVKGQSVNVMYSVNEEEPVKLNLIPSDFRAGESSDIRWALAVLNQIRETAFETKLKKGVNTITVYPQEAGVVLQQIGVYETGKAPKKAYLGEEETFWIN